MAEATPTPQPEQARHTPVWRPGQGRSIISDTGGFIAQVYDGSVDPAKLGQFGQPGGPAYDIATEVANHRLACAAPDLLAACEAFVREHDDTYGGEAISTGLLKAIHQARAAVIKAKGGGQ
jgi:hypothetical protein